MKRLSLSVLTILLALPLADAQAGPLRDRIRERVQERQVSGGSEEANDSIWRMRRRLCQSRLLLIATRVSHAASGRSPSYFRKF